MSSTAPSGHHRAQGRSHRDLVTGLTSGFVGALALATSLYNVYLQRQQVRAQVWPKLTVQDARDGDRYGVSIANRGVGPADVRRVRVLVDGKPTRSWTDAFRKLLHGQSVPLPRAPAIETTLANGQEVVFLSYELREWLELMQEREHVSMQFCYCSTLDECWELTNPWGDASGGDVTTAVNDCHRDVVPFTPTTGDEISAHLAARLADVSDGGSDAAMDARDAH